MRRKYLTQGVRNAAHVCLFLSLLTVAFSMRAGPTAVTLAWDPSTDSTVTGYNIYYGGASHSYTNVVSAGNATSAVVSNLVGGATYYFAATTYTAAGLESDYSLEASYIVPAPNVPPTLDPIPDLTIPQDATEQTVYFTGVTSGSINEAQTLSVSAFSSNPGLIPSPIVDYASPDPIGFLSFAPVPGSYGSSIITVMVDDGAAISNTVIRSFTVTVTPVNNPPTIDILSDVVVNENAAPQPISLTGISSGSTNSSANLAVTATSSNPGVVPAPTVTYASPSSTGTLILGLATNGFGTAKIIVTVSDDQPTNNVTSVSFQVTVNQTITPGLLTNAIVAPNSTFRFAVNPPSATDKFSISLAPGAPAGVKLATRHGITWLAWTPTMNQASTTNLIGLKLVDSTNPALSTNETVQVIVQDYLALTMGSTSLQAGQSGSVSIALASSEGVTNLTFSMPWPTNTLSNPSLSITAAGVASSSLRNQGSGIVANVQMAAGQSLQGSNVIGSIIFQSQATQPSSFISLPVSGLTALKPSSIAYTTAFSTPGQVAVVNNFALLQPGATTSPTPTLTVFAKVGNSYQVQYATNFGVKTTWYPLLSYTQTNVSQSVPLSTTIPQAFYRVQQK